MNNISGNKLEKLVFRIFDQMVEGADKYVTKQGSTWLIFTESKKWVIEFTKDKTLWFNYNIFKGELELIGKDCIEEMDLIKNWFESRFLNKPKVDEIWDNSDNMYFHIENTIQNGVKHTNLLLNELKDRVEETIQHGVKDTHFNFQSGLIQVEDTIENGVKDTYSLADDELVVVEDLNGVKNTSGSNAIQIFRVEDTIQNGVKETTFVWDMPRKRIKDTIENGEKIELK
jgi:hypothetical protein